MTGFLIVGLGGAIGAMLRYGVGILATRAFGFGFPSGTMIVNIVGSFAMGALIAWLAHRGETVGAEMRLFLAVGVLGGFTTFSAFSLDVITLYERGQTETALFYVVFSVAASIMALFAGLWLVRNLT